MYSHFGTAILDQVVYATFDLPEFPSARAEPDCDGNLVDSEADLRHVQNPFMLIGVPTLIQPTIEDDQLTQHLPVHSRFLPLG